MIKTWNIIVKFYFIRFICYRIKAPPEPRRISLRIAKMDPAGVPLPEDLLVRSEPVEEHVSS